MFGVGEDVASQRIESDWARVMKFKFKKKKGKKRKTFFLNYETSER